MKIVSITDYTLKDKICDSNDPTDCGSGSQKTFYITIGYKDNAYDSTNTHYGFNLDFEFKKVYDITYSGFTNPPVTPITVMDGDKPTGVKQDITTHKESFKAGVEWILKKIGF